MTRSLCAPLRSLVAPAFLTMLAATLIAACGDDSDSGNPGNHTTGGSGSVTIRSDPGPVGDPELLRDPDSGTQNQRVAITPDGVPTTIYEIPAKQLKPGMRLTAMATVTLTKCAITDYIPVPSNRAFTACEGTKRYSFDPLWIESGFRLVGSGAGPDGGIKVGEPVRTRCTTAVHHCTLAQSAEITLDAGDLRGGPHRLILAATATSDHAVSCDPPKAARCDVLAIETQKGTAMYAIQIEGNPKRATNPPDDATPNLTTLPVHRGVSSADPSRRVVYSVPLASAEDIDDLEGDQMELSGKLRVAEQLEQAPLVSVYLVLTDSPTGTEGRYLLSDTYNPGKSGTAGGNCDSACELSRPAAISHILACDLKAGRRYVNLVAVAQRKVADRGDTVSVRPGGFLKVTRYFDSEQSGSGTGGRTCRS